MKVQELRIGNIIGDGHFMFNVVGIENGIINGRVFDFLEMRKIEDIYEDGVYSLNDFNIEGIPFTEEWLLKFGAVEDEYIDKYIPCPCGIDMRFYLTFGRIQLCKGATAPMFNFDHVKYVHQLQNLYFALTGEELKLK